MIKEKSYTVHQRYMNRLVQRNYYVFNRIFLGIRR